MESKIRLAPLCPTRPTCKLTHSSRQSVRANTQEQQRQVEEAAQGLTQRLSAFPASERHSLRAPETKGPSASRRLAARPGPLAQLLSGPAGSPGRPPPAPLPSGLSPHPSLAGDSLLCVSPRAHSPRNAGLFSNATRGSQASPTRPDRLGVRGGVWTRTRERGTQSRADLTAAAPPLQSSLGSATYGLDKQPSHYAPRRLPPRAAPSPQSAPKSR